ncbi:nicotinate-nucleotide adenylyltransferase [bacterium]|nr:nicotinate-nucleotide adenylyltransferase [bacterium]MBU1024377.1 nicotinate-nucleotide adenylyltransferase [bacterium]
MENIKRLGILGGSFDPPHEAHLAMARKACNAFKLDKVMFIPCHQNPLKDITGHASPYHRVTMCQLATLVEDDFPVTPLEVIRGGISFTIDTLKDLKKTGAELHLLLGLDSYLTIGEWKDADLYPKYCKLIVFTRDGDFEDKVVPAKIRKITQFITGFDMPISSTDIRKMVRSGKKIERLVTPLVDVYIKKYELYKHFRDQNRLIDDPIKKFFLRGV